MFRDSDWLQPTKHSNRQEHWGQIRKQALRVLFASVPTHHEWQVPKTKEKRREKENA